MTEARSPAPANLVPEAAAPSVSAQVPTPGLDSLAKSFVPAAIESEWTHRWEQSGLYEPTLDAAKPSFSIQLPPPNVTGTLHMGHAFNQTIMDSLTRYHRMRGYNTLWVPGTDHAGIATQIVVERQLQGQGKSRHDLGRKNFVAKVWEWKEESGSTITRGLEARILHDGPEDVGRRDFDLCAAV
jgi:valyl-tRNA synthetase